MNFPEHKVADLLNKFVASNPRIQEQFGAVLRELVVEKTGLRLLLYDVESRVREVMFVRDAEKQSWFPVLPKRPTNFDPWDRWFVDSFTCEGDLGKWLPLLRRSDGKIYYFRVGGSSGENVVKCMGRETKELQHWINLDGEWVGENKELQDFLLAASLQANRKTVCTSVDNPSVLIDQTAVPDFPIKPSGRIKSIHQTLITLPNVASCHFMLRNHSLHGLVDTIGGEVYIYAEASKSSVSFADVFGMEELKDFVRTSVIAPLKDRVAAEKYGLKSGGGLLLYGLPGTGKTFFAKAIAGELGLPFYAIDSSDIFGRYIGESEQRVKALFNQARSNSMSVVFIDEIDAILCKRSEDVGETRQDVVNIILQECDGINLKGKNPFFMIGATNFPMRLDEAALSRFGAVVEIPLPDEETRKAVLKSEIYKMDIGVDDSVITQTTSITEGWSTRDICTLANHYRQRAYIEHAARVDEDFCLRNFKEFKTQNATVADGIAQFKSQMGKR